MTRWRLWTSATVFDASVSFFSTFCTYSPTLPNSAFTAWKIELPAAAEAGKMGIDGGMPDVKSLRIPVRYLANLLTEEHPQISAVFIAHLGAHRVGKVHQQRIEPDNPL